MRRGLPAFGPHRDANQTPGGLAVVVNGRLDVLAADELARAFFSDVFDSGTKPPNFARYQFADPKQSEGTVLDTHPYV